MSIPDSVTALAQARMDARAAKDFALADKFRDELLQAGFEIVDVAGGYELRPKKPYITLAYPRDIRPIDLCLLYTSPSPRDRQKSRMPSSA